MAETKNISEMANRISEEIFKVFGWERVGQNDKNWPCINPDHKKKTHPTDCVFTYPDPYSNSHTYFNCDLKSYKETSITTKSFRDSLISLAMGSSCAKKSKEWQNAYITNEVNSNIHGLLFIFNYNNLYDKDLYIELEKITKTALPLNINTKLFLITPKDIRLLNTIANDIMVSIGKNVLPSFENISFFYPDQDSRITTKSNWKKAATIEMLKSQWIILKHRKDSSIPNYDGLTIYYKSRGTIREEFVYLIDYLVHWQIISSINNITIKLVNPDESAFELAEKAKSTYCSRYSIYENHESTIKSIKIKSVQNVIPTFYEAEIGME